MTNYITQMMETAGISKDYMPNYVDVFQIHWTIMGYPPFTAEKQIEIIKLIVQNGTLTTLQIEYFTKEKDYKLSTYQKAANYNKDFSEALAQLTTELMNTGELDKEKVKEILKNG